MKGPAAQSRVRELAANSKNLVWTDHIYEQMDARSIDADDVLQILRSGYVDEPPTPGNKEDDWKVEIGLRLKSGRVGVVVTVIEKQNRLILVTTFWRDHQ